MDWFISWYVRPRFRRPWEWQFWRTLSYSFWFNTSGRDTTRYTAHVIVNLQQITRTSRPKGGEKKISKNWLTSTTDLHRPLWAFLKLKIDLHRPPWGSGGSPRKFLGSRMANYPISLCKFPFYERKTYEKWTDLLLEATKFPGSYALGPLWPLMQVYIYVFVVLIDLWLHRSKDSVHDCVDSVYQISH